MYNKNKVEKYTLRKSSKYKNVYSVGLGVFVAAAVGGVTAGEASAHEAENSNSSTNFTELQGDKSDSHSYTLENTGNKNGDLKVNVDSSNLDKEVSEAKKLGIIVNKKEVKDLGVSITPDETNKKANDIAKDYKDQATKINETVTKYKADKEKHKAEVEKITLENKAILAKYKADVEAYNKKVKEVQAHNKAVQDKYDKELAEFNANVDKINKENAKAKAEYEKAYQDYLAKMKKFEEDNKKKEEAHKSEVAKYEKEKEKIQTDNATAKDVFAKATEKYNKDKAAAEKANADALAKHKTDVAKYEADKQRIEAENKAKQDKYNADLDKYEKDKTAIEKSNKAKTDKSAVDNTEYEKRKAEIEKSNKAKKDKYNADLDKYEKDKAAIEKSNKAKQDKNAVDNTEYEKRKAEVEKSNKAKQDKYNADLAKYEQDKSRVKLNNQSKKAQYDVAVNVYNNNKKRIEASNKAKLDKHKKDLERYNAEVERITAENTRKQIDYHNKKIAIDGHNASIETRNRIARENYESRLASYERRMAEYNHNVANATPTIHGDISMNVTTRTQGTSGGYVGNFHSGASFMNSWSDSSGNFTFNHDMVYGSKTVGEGTLSGRINHTSRVNSDGSITINVSSVTLDSYSYTARDTNWSHRNPIKFRAEAPNGGTMYSKTHGGKTDFTDYIGRTYNINHSVTLQPGESTDLTQFIELHDDWDWDTYGWGYVSYSNNSTVTPPSDPGPAPEMPDEPDVDYDELDDIDPPELESLPPKPIEPKLEEEPNKPTPPTLENEPVKPTPPTLENVPPKPNTPTLDRVPDKPTPPTLENVPPKPDTPTLDRVPDKPTPPTLENVPPKPDTPTLDRVPDKPTPPVLETVPTKPVDPKLVSMPEPPVPPVEKPSPDKPVKPGVDPAPVKPVKPKDKALPTPPVRGVDNTIPPKPGDPKYKEIPKEPIAPVINYNYSTFTSQPNVLKTALNSDNKSIDGEYVAKASTIKWELKTERLPANRQEITSFVITDSFPPGFELDLAKTRESSKGFNVKYNKKTNTAVFKMNKDALKELNGNLDREYTPKFPTAIGSVMNDGATYENTFKLEIEEKLPNLGNVIINYVDESGNPLSESITDVKDGEMGESYDTTDNKPLQIAKGGKIYKLINVQGTEIGKITQGNTEVTYVYKETPPAPNTGTVVIHFVDEEGNPLKDDNFIHNGVKVGTDYDSSKYVTSTITKNGIEYKYTEKVDGVEKGKVTEGVTEVTYVYKRVTPEKPGKSYIKYSNKVKVYTPGKSKTPPPTGTDGTPGDPTNDPNRDPIAPVKKVSNSEGVDINNTVTTIGQTLHYTLEWDLDQYKNIKVTAEDIARGFYYVDDFPEDVLITDDAKVTFTDTQGNAIKGIKVETFDSFDKVPDKAKEVLTRAMITPKGSFQLFSVENPQEFFDNYVVKGVDILIHNPMYVKSVKDNVEYINKGYQIDFGNGYETNEVTNKVETPDPGKENTNKDGVNINGKSVLPGTVNYYKLTWDLDQYKGMKAGADEVGKGFYFVDDFPEDALSVNEKGVTLTDSNGSPVTGVTMTIYESLEKAPDNIKQLLAKTNIKGAFQVFSADNPTEFFNKYVTTGTNITINNPMTINESILDTGGEFSNTAYQIDFNNIFETETVVNNVPKIEPTKDIVLDAKDSTSFNGKSIELGKVFNYKLTGSKLLANRGEAITQYGFVDDYDEVHDKYDGHYIVVADTNITLKDGTTIKQGEEITKHSTQQHNNGVVSIEMNQDFLAGISENSEFGASAYIQVERVKSGENIKNVYTNIINGMESLSNTVTSNTPEPPKPTPKKEIPPVPVKETPPPPVVQPAPPVVKELPKTDSNSTSGAVALATGLAGAALVASKRRKRPKFR